MPVIAADANLSHWLLCRVGKRLCALPIDSLVETMRPLPIRPMVQSPPFVLGLCIIRGEPVPVVDTAALLGEREARGGRLVTVRVGERLVALAVDSVIGLRSLGAESGAALPPLLKEAAGDVVAAVGTLDAELLLFLRAARLAPDAVFEGVKPSGAV
jgi:purine-binding chemotaxis protein CheW